MRFPIKKILTLAKDDYERAWMDTSHYLKKEGHLFDLKPKGQSHPLKDFMEDARNALINLGDRKSVV